MVVEILLIILALFSMVYIGGQVDLSFFEKEAGRYWSDKQRSFYSFLNIVKKNKVLNKRRHYLKYTNYIKGSSGTISKFTTVHTV